MPRLKSGLVIPTNVSSVKPPKFTCRVIVKADGMVQCGKQFSDEEGRAYQQHVTACAKQHHDQIVAASRRTRMPGFYGPDAADREAEEWMSANREEVLEGRKSLYGRKVNYKRIAAQRRRGRRR